MAKNLSGTKKLGGKIGGETRESLKARTNKRPARGRAGERRQQWLSGQILR
jgi:hypothetical protein